MKADRVPSVAPAGVAGIEESYEDLRRHATRRGPGELFAGHGLALFLSRGMAAWMRSVRPLLPAAAPAGASSPVVVGIPTRVREELTGFLVSVLLGREGGR